MITTRIGSSLSSIQDSAAANEIKKAQKTAQPASTPATGAFTGLTSFAISHDIADLAYSTNETVFGYRNSDQSLALRASSTTSISLKTEHIAFDMTFTAESLGLSAKNFADPKKPITLNFSYTRSDVEIYKEITIQKVKTLRKPEEILTDLAKALREVLKDQGNKTVSYVLDPEALEVLLSADPKMGHVLGELVMLMASINLQKQQGKRNDYTILVSGKGNPYLDINESTDVQGKQVTVEFNLTILPPGAQNETTTQTAEPETTENEME